MQMQTLSVNKALYLYHPDQTPASYPFWSIDASLITDTDADANAWCGQGLSLHTEESTSHGADSL